MASIEMQSIVMYSVVTAMTEFIDDYSIYVDKQLVRKLFLHALTRFSSVGIQDMTPKVPA